MSHDKRVDEYISKTIELLMARKFGKDSDEDPILDELDAIYDELSMDGRKLIAGELDKLRKAENMKDVDVNKYQGAPVYVRLCDLFNLFEGFEND